MATSTTTLKLVKPTNAIVFAEIEKLRGREKRLANLYPQLETKPQFRDRFLRQLAELQERADHLDSILGTTLVA